MSDRPAQQWRTLLRDSLPAARKARDSVRVAAVRSALSAIDNGETPDAAHVDAPRSETIAGGVLGLGAAEVPRRDLSDGQIRALLRSEIDERLAAASHFADGGHPERAATLRAEADVLAELLGDV
jgi:uncharacterized protein